MSNLRRLFLLSFIVLATACDSISGLIDPLRGVETLSDVALDADAESSQLIATDLSAEEVVQEVLEGTEPSGFFAIFRKSDDANPKVDEEAAQDSAAEVSSQEQGGLFDFFKKDQAPVVRPVARTTEVVASPADVEVTAPTRSGLFGLFKTSAAPEAGPEPTPNVESPRPIWALFGGSRPNEDLSDETTLAPLEFGTLRPACGATKTELGEVISSTSGFKVYDSDPGGTALRSHYITGFDDGCPQEFLAALVLFGDVGTHEIVRYSQTRVRMDYSETDRAYEEIKSAFCRVDEGEPCGDRLEKLGKVTTFVTAYETFGAGPEWAEFLLHKGRVAAVDLESP